jgi:predicted RNA-binding protein YlqC (UPF0109 family)
MDKSWRPNQSNSGRFNQKGSGYQDRLSGPVDPSTAAEDLAEYVLKTLGRQDSNLQITRETSGERGVRVITTCDPTVTGRLIGKGGKTISALRLLVKSLGQKRGKQVDVEIT